MKSRRIFNEVILNYSRKNTCKIDDFPLYEELKSTINRKKRKLLPQESEDPLSSIIDEAWKKTLIEEEKFLQFDETIDNNRIVEDVLNNIED